MFYAKAMVFPSLYEGFGIPIVDAMKLGTPVIASRCTAISEIGSDCIHYFEDPFDSRQMAQDLASFFQNSDKLEQLSTQGIIKGNEYSSVNTATSTLKAFQSIVKKAQQRQSYVDLTTVSTYSSFSNTQRLSIVLNCLNLTNINQFIDLINGLKLNCQIIPILNLHSCDQTENLVEFRTLSLKCKFPIKPVYSFGILDSESELYSILNFTYDSVVSTKYVMYCSFDTLAKYCNVIDIVTPCTYLDAFSTLSAVKLCPDTNEPIEVQPLSGLALAEAYETLKKIKLKFFELTFLKSTLQSEGYHPGCFKYLSQFLSSSTYLKLPMHPASLKFK
ncbi:hypothetical protein PROH_14630 [Prochlorothrix hollandica PCC 9006 = CALU 1027]|uniref:Glycosyl transferase family 1 domain-containing protein n=2 Tax=Prochlorothrix hollandica TaxID=1223 RepID=A0A0M2PXC4_PROHO|nr:hypothetical protein PROH_14630 [Prochlorothrix hollandica PCC 9006 = CALU 1027]